jgi:hypothetical protein
MRKQAVILMTDDAEYPFNVQQWIKVDKGIWCYCGNGKFCKTLKDAKKEKRRIKRRKEISR